MCEVWVSVGTSVLAVAGWFGFGWACWELGRRRGWEKGRLSGIGEEYRRGIREGHR